MKRYLMDEAFDIEGFLDYANYDPDTGIFRWTKSPGGRVRAGDICGTSDADGYRVVRFRYKDALLHRVAFYCVHGRWPDGEIDHESGVRHGNEASNLRECSGAENKTYIGVKANNTSGYPGVDWFPLCGKYRARIHAGGRLRHLGLFESAEDAYRAYRAAKSKLHPFAPNGRDLPPIPEQQVA